MPAIQAGEHQLLLHYTPACTERSSLCQPRPALPRDSALTTPYQHGSQSGGQGSANGDGGLSGEQLRSVVSVLDLCGAGPGIHNLAVGEAVENDGVLHRLPFFIGGYPSRHLVALADDVIYTHTPGRVLRKPPPLKGLFCLFFSLFESPLVEDLLVPALCDGFVLF